MTLRRQDRITRAGAGILALLAIPVVSILRLAIGPGFLGGQATTIVLLLLMSSFQLFFLFILGQYVARIYDEARARPLYVLASTRNIDAESESVADSLEVRLNPANNAPTLQSEAASLRARGE